MRRKLFTEINNENIEINLGSVHIWRNALLGESGNREGDEGGGGGGVMILAIYVILLFQNKEILVKRR